MERSESISLQSYRSFPFRSSRKGTSQRGARGKKIVLSIPTDLPWILIGTGFLFGHASIFNGLFPFGIAFIAALRATGSRSLHLFPISSVFLGMATAASLWASVPYYAAFILLWVIKGRAHDSPKAKRYWMSAIIGTFLIKMIVHLIIQPMPAVILIGLTECTIAVVSYSVIFPLLQRQTAEQVAHRETQWILLILAGILAIGMWPGGVPIRLLLCLYLTVGAARLGGLTLSSLVGSALAFGALLLGEPVEFVAALIGCGVLTGTFARLKGGLVIGAVLPALLSSGGQITGDTVRAIFTAVAASGLVYATPTQFLRQLARIIPGTSFYQDRQASYTERVREVMDEKLAQYLKVFEELAAAMQSRNDSFVSQQLQGMADVIRTMSREFSPGIRFTEKLEDTILHEFAGEDFKYVTALYGVDGFEIHGALRNRCDSKRLCEGIAQCCSRTLDSQGYDVTKRCCEENGKCGFTIEPRPRFKLKVEMAKVAQQGVSGDNQVIFELSNSKTALLLSDGMGVGKRAHIESSIAIRLLQVMVKAGYDLEKAVSLVNKILLIRSQDEIFVTIDLVVVDLYTGQLEFVKIGSAPSFIKRGREVEVIHNNSLPAGILSHVDVERDRRLLKEGEVLIMATDGVLEAKRHIAKKDEWMWRMLRRVDGSLGLREMAEQVLFNSIQAAHGRVEDDMMVLTARLVRTEQEIETYRRIS